MAITRTQIRHEMFERIPGLGFNGTADSYTTTSLTDTFQLADTSLGANYFRNFYIHRYLKTDDDRIKKGNVLNPVSGTLIHTGSAYADTAAGVYEIIGLLHPDELNACIKRAMRRIYADVLSPIYSMVDDGDMEAADATQWTNVGLATMQKSTTHVYSGTQSLNTVSNSTSDEAASNSFRVTPDSRFYASAIVKNVIGNAKFSVYDVTNAADIVSITTTTISSSIQAVEGIWNQVYLTGIFPATCRQAQVRLGGTTDSSSNFWAHALCYLKNDMILEAPTWLDEQHKFLKLREAQYKTPVTGFTIAGTGGGGMSDANSRTWSDWVQPSQFSVDILPQNDAVSQIQINKPLPDNELWIQGRRPYSDFVDMADETDSTDAPPNLVYAYTQEEVARTLRRRYPNDKRFDIVLAEAALEMDAQTVSRPEIPMQPRKREHWSVV